MTNDFIIEKQDMMTIMTMMTKIDGHVEFNILSLKLRTRSTR